MCHIKCKRNSKKKEKLFQRNQKIIFAADSGVQDPPSPFALSLPVYALYLGKSSSQWQCRVNPSAPSPRPISLSPHTPLPTHGFGTLSLLLPSFPFSKFDPSTFLHLLAVQDCLTPCLHTLESGWDHDNRLISSPPPLLPSSPLLGLKSPFGRRQTFEILFLPFHFPNFPFPLAWGFWGELVGFSHMYMYNSAYLACLACTFPFGQVLSLSPNLLPLPVGVCVFALFGLFSFVPSLLSLLRGV